MAGPPCVMGTRRGGGGGRAGEAVPNRDGCGLRIATNTPHPPASQRAAGRGKIRVRGWCSSSCSEREHGSVGAAVREDKERGSGWRRRHHCWQRQSSGTSSSSRSSGSRRQPRTAGAHQNRPQEREEESKGRTSARAAAAEEVEPRGGRGGCREAWQHKGGGGGKGSGILTIFTNMARTDGRTDTPFNKDA